MRIKNRAMAHETAFRFTFISAVLNSILIYILLDGDVFRQKGSERSPNNIALRKFVGSAYRAVYQFAQSESCAVTPVRICNGEALHVILNSRDCCINLNTRTTVPEERREGP
jgi:hypothetical protein